MLLSTQRIRNIFKNVFYRCLPKHILFFKGQINNNSKRIALTFDDGPHPECTQHILNVLKEANVKATFFLSGSKAKKYPGLVKQVIEDKHEIGNHAFSHHRLEMSYVGISKEVQETDRVIQNLAGATPKFFRPPYGKLNLKLLLYIFLKKKTLVLWSLDSGDSYDKSSNRIRDRLKTAKPGDIILMHEDSKHILEVLPLIIRDIKKKRLNFVTISKVIEKL